MAIDSMVEIKPLPDLTAENVSENGVQEEVVNAKLRLFGVQSSELGRIRRKRNQVHEMRIAIAWAQSKGLIRLSLESRSDGSDLSRRRSDGCCAPA